MRLHEEFMTGGWNLHRRREQQWQAPLPAPGQALQSYTAGLSNWWPGNRPGNSPGEKQNKSYKEVLFQVLIKVQKQHFSWSFRCYYEIPLEKDGKRRHVHVKKKGSLLGIWGMTWVWLNRQPKTRRIKSGSLSWRNHHFPDV